VSIALRGSPPRRLRLCGKPAGPRPSHSPSLLCSHSPSRSPRCLSSSRAGGFVRCATSSGRYDLLSVLIIFTDQQHDTVYVFRRSKPGRGSVSHLTHGPLAGSQARSFGRSHQPCTLVTHLRDPLCFSSQGYSVFAPTRSARPPSFASTSPPGTWACCPNQLPPLPPVLHPPPGTSRARSAVSLPTP
jgi:hypothetical protein